LQTVAQKTALHIHAQRQSAYQTRSTGTVQTSAKARLTTTSVAIWRISMSECPLTTFLSSNSDESGKQSLYPDGDPDRQQNLTKCSLAHCQPSPENFMQIRSEVFGHIRPTWNSGPPIELSLLVSPPLSVPYSIEQTWAFTVVQKKWSEAAHHNSRDACWGLHMERYRTRREVIRNQTSLEKLKEVKRHAPRKTIDMVRNQTCSTHGRRQATQ